MIPSLFHSDLIAFHVSLYQIFKHFKLIIEPYSKNFDIEVAESEKTKKIPESKVFPKIRLGVVRILRHTKNDFLDPFITNLPLKFFCD